MRNDLSHILAVYPQGDFGVREAQEERGLSRRDFVRLLGAGLVIAVGGGTAAGQRAGGRRPQREAAVAARLHIGKDGVITVMTGKVEAGQGSRAELTQAAAEELRVPVERIELVMADTALVPDDGMTAGSGTTPRTVPAVRRGAAAARMMLVDVACKQWNVEPSAVKVERGKVIHSASGREISYAELANLEDVGKAFGQNLPADVEVTPVKEWKVLGLSVPRPHGRDFVTGAHQYPSDITRPGMLYGKVLRPPSYGAQLTSIDLAPAKAMKDVVVVQDGSFVGIAAPTRYAAEQALAAIARTGVWKSTPQPPSSKLYDDLRQHARGGVPESPWADELASAAKTVRQTYNVAYAQHAPLEPRAAVAEWEGDKLTVWTGTQNPFGVRGELAKALEVPADRVRVIVPDFGGGFGGKHFDVAAVEAARLAKAAGRPVSLRWTRQEEFTWAYFRPAGVIDIQASLDAQGSLTSWHHVNINSGPSSIETPYRAGKAQSKFVQSQAPLRQGSYRGLAATANTFARECCMDELAAAAGADPLDFRLTHLDDQRLRAVLEAAAKAFDWRTRVKQKSPDVGVGLACGTEKGSYVAACAQVAVDRAAGKIIVRRVCQAYECGAILNPGNLLSQVQGAVMMGLGPALREEVRFEDGKLLNASFGGYLVPRISDLPELDIHLLDRPDLPSTGAGETPIIAVAPAVANAVFHAVGVRCREMPIRLAKA
jgi:isoquinoline 1-oxidoreductase subunit beta